MESFKNFPFEKFEYGSLTLKLVSWGVNVEQLILIYGLKKNYQVMSIIHETRNLVSNAFIWLSNFLAQNQWKNLEDL